MSIPGNVDLSQYNPPKVDHLPSLSLSPRLVSLSHRQPLVSSQSGNKKTILLASNILDENTMFMNGLGQNIGIFYHLFESMGYKTYLVQYNGAPNKAMGYYDVITPNDIIRKNLEVHLYIEIGMSLDPTTRNYLRSIGAKIVKIYLGNILNIDIETVQSYIDFFFHHHLVGEVDDIWMSPHYLQNLEYGLAINQVDIKKGKIVPYVWEPVFFNYGLDRPIRWIEPTDWRNTDIIIMDPNISFQKASFYSVLLANAFAKKCKEWMGNVVIINGDKLEMNSNMKNFVLPQMDGLKGRVKLERRKTIHEALEGYPSACFITNQFTNPFNYMTFELMYCGFPIVHNSDGWEDFGYYYSINKWASAIDTLENAMKNHSVNMPIYKSHVASLLWRHSIYNPDIQKEWANIIEKNI